MADGDSVSEITFATEVDESAATATTASSSATTAASEDEKNTGTVKNETTEEGNTVEDFSQETTETVREEYERNREFNQHDKVLIKFSFFIYL